MNIPRGEIYDCARFLLAKVEGCAKIMNAAAEKLREKGYKAPMRDMIKKEADRLGGLGASSMSGILDYKAGRFYVNEKKFFEMFARTDAGKYARAADPVNFGHFIRTKPKR